MEIKLRAEQAAFVQELVEAELFLIPEQVIETALILLEDQYELYKVKRDKLRELIAVGVEQADRGECAPLDMETILAKARQRAQQMPEANGCPR